MTKAEYVARAKKAVATRKANARKKMLSDRAKKAWATRRSYNAS